MPFSHEVNADASFGVIRLSGTVSGTDLLDALAWFYGHDDWAPGSRVLWDGRMIEAFALTPRELHAAAEIVAEAVGRLGLDRTAVVACDLNSYMGGFLFAARLGKWTGREARVFAEFAPALEWLATPSPPLSGDDLERVPHARSTAAGSGPVIGGVSTVGGDGAPGMSTPPME